MTVRLIEIYESTRIHSNDSKRNFSLREVFINPDQVVCLREAPEFKQKLLEGILPKDLDKRQEFTHVYLNRGQSGLDIFIVGAPSLVEKKLTTNKKQLLKG